MALGDRLKRLRNQTGLGLKRAAPNLGITYTYLSKLENDRAVPSEELLQRMATYYGADEGELMLEADKIPPDVRRILRENPREAMDYLRERFARGVARE